MITKPDLFDIRHFVETCPLDMLQWREEIVPFAEWINTTLEPRRILEVGTGAGGLTLLWTHLVGRGGDVISIDDTDPESYFARQERLQPLLPREVYLTIFNGPSQGASAQLMTQRYLDHPAGPRKVDLLFLDGDHSYEGVKADWNFYKELVRPGGVVAFHDYNSERWPGIAELCGEIAAGAAPEAVKVFSVQAEWGGIFAVTV